MKFINRWKLQEAEQRQSTIEQYHTLCRMAATAGELSDVDGAKLKKCAVDLGFATDQVVADIAIIQRAATLIPIAADRDKLIAEGKSVGMAQQALEQLKADFLMAYKAKGDRLGARRGAIQAAHGVALAAANELQAIQSQHADLLGLNTKAKPIGYIIAQADADKFPSLTNGARCWTIEKCEMQAGNQSLAITTDLTAFDFQRLEWQDVGEFKKLHARLRELVRISGNPDLCAKHAAELKQRETDRHAADKERRRSLGAGEIDPALIAAGV